jgi:quinolinate synthase
MAAAAPISIALEDEIDRLKRERNAVVLAHFYQDSEIQDVADVIGDSLQLAQAAARTSAEVICFAGVHFMAETAKILNPERVVVLPDLEAGCSLASGCPADRFAAWIEKRATAEKKRPTVVSYINCSAEVKALSDYIVTSSNAETIVRNIPEDQTILFGPDKNLGAYLERKIGRKLHLWPGSCVVHETFSLRKLLALKERHPHALVIAHPECEAALLAAADFVGSTTALLRFAVSNAATEFIVATEPGILHPMRRQAPDKTFIPAPPEANCACNECPFMKKNTLEKVYFSLRDLKPRIEMTAALMDRARKPIDRMLALS